jgi:hypothetical protein
VDGMATCIICGKRFGGEDAGHLHADEDASGVQELKFYPDACICSECLRREKAGFYPPPGSDDD